MEEKWGQLMVEGNNDQFVIINLLIKHGVFKKGAKKDKQPVEVIDKTGIDKLLLSAVENATSKPDKPTGFVLDIDMNLDDRWRQVSKEILVPLGIEPPAHCPPEGYIARSTKTNNNIGIWLMPDNKSAGALEYLLLDLVPADSEELWNFASECTDASLKHRAKIPSQSALKARLHCWLAWQEKPGEPYGKAIEFNYLGHESSRVHAFVAWFRQLYAL